MKKAAVPSILVAVVLLAVAVIAEAQQPKKVFRIGYLRCATSLIDLAENYRRSLLRGQNPEGSLASRPAGGTTDEVRAGDKPQDREADRLTIPQSVLYRADKVIK